MPDVLVPAAVEQPPTIKRRGLATRPSLRSLALTTLPDYISPHPLPSQLSARLRRLCNGGDQQLQSLIGGLRSKELDVDEWQRRLWRRVTENIQPTYQQAFQVRAHPHVTSPASCRHSFIGHSLIARLFEV